MTSVSAKASVISRRGRSLSGAIVSTIAALVVASGAAAWIADFDPAAFLSQPVPLKDNSRLTFGDRFSLGSTARSTIKDADPLSLDQSVIREFNIKIQEAKVRLAQKLQSSEWRTALITVPTPWTSMVPFPFLNLGRLRQLSIRVAALLQFRPTTGRCYRSFPICSRGRLHRWLPIAGS